MITALSYIGIRSNKSDDWRQFAGNVLGMQVLDHGGRNTAFRMDDQRQRLIISDEPGDTLAYIGWEVGEKSDLERLATKLEAAGHNVTPGDRGLADRRYVTEIITCVDPAGESA